MSSTVWTPDGFGKIVGTRREAFGGTSFEISGPGFKGWYKQAEIGDIDTDMDADTVTDELARIHDQENLPWDPRPQNPVGAGDLLETGLEHSVSDSLDSLHYDDGRATVQAVRHQRVSIDEPFEGEDIKKESEPDDSDEEVTVLDEEEVPELRWANIQLLGGGKTSGWADVRNKAKGLRDSMSMSITRNDGDYIEATIQGTNGQYEAYVQRHGSASGSFKVTGWGCTCKWGEWAYKREHTYVGRMCSHALALYYEMQSLGYKQDDTVTVESSRVASWGEGSCPDCGYDEINADGEPDEDGSFPVSCPNCNWKGVDNEDVRGHSDTYHEARMARIAGKAYSLAEQDALINEAGMASQFSKLRLEDSHYLLP